MESFISSWIVFAVTMMIGKILCNPVNSSLPTEVTYAELETLGFSCYPEDSCQTSESRLDPSCDCDSSCAIYGTCCVNSEFRVPKNSSKFESNIKCLSVYNDPGYQVFMVDSCKDNETPDNLCLSDPEESNDPFLLIPVTSYDTGITYKNYFCAICNEEIDSDRIEFWEMEVEGRGGLYSNLSEPQLKFNKAMDSWTVDDNKSKETYRDLPVTLKILKNDQKAKLCRSNMIQTCASNWKDEAVALKCEEYMAEVVGSRYDIYKNPHCALCNFEIVSDNKCLRFGYGGASSFGGITPFDVPLVSLFVLEDRPRRCGRNMVYDKFADKCRCDSRIYKKENGECVHKV